jgi:hypothetical protein
MNDIHRQIGEMIATQQAFRETMQEVKAAIESASIDRRSYEAELRRGYELLSHRIIALEKAADEQHRCCADRFRIITHDISVMKEPVAQFVTMRNRASRVALVMMSIAGVVWALAEPIYQLVIARLLGGHKS